MLPSIDRALGFELGQLPSIRTGDRPLRVVALGAARRHVGFERRDAGVARGLRGLLLIDELQERRRVIGRLFGLLLLVVGDDFGFARRERLLGRAGVLGQCLLVFG